VAAQAKARALAHRLGGGSDAAESEAAAAESEAYEKVCGAWWKKVQQQVRDEAASGGALRILEYSVLLEDRLVIWVMSGGGGVDAMNRPVISDGLARGAPQLLCCETVRDWCAIKELLRETRDRMVNIEGRDGEEEEDGRDREEDSMVNNGGRDGEEEAEGRDREEMQEADVRGGEPGLRGWPDVTAYYRGTREDCFITRLVKDRVDKVITCALLCALHTRLITPVEEHLGGAKELLIVPHKELSEVPWAALRNKDRRPVTHRWPLLSSRRRRYLVQDHVIRVAPSLDVARKAAENMPPAQSEHALVVGNPTRDLSCAERESRNVQQTLTRAGVRKVDYYERGEATKARVKESLLGLSDGSVCIWAHLACHGDVVAHSLKLAPGDGPSPENGDLSMEEVQGTGVRLGKGSTVVLSACNSGRGEIKAEGVVGLARSFLWAGAAATVVSLWKVRCLVFFSGHQAFCTLLCFARESYQDDTVSYATKLARLACPGERQAHL
jgi:hypothetical protein